LYPETRVTYCKSLHHSTEIVKFHNLSLTVMNSSNGINQNNDRTKMRAAIPAAGAIVTAAILLSGLTLIAGYQQPVLAQQQQQNMTGGAGNATNATMTGAAGNATNATMTGAAGNATNATMTGAAGNVTSGTGGEELTPAQAQAAQEGSRQ
jgi:hypothetical protein